MSDQFRLVFSGEVLEGQHAAVVKKRLAAVLKLDDDRMAVLFSGNPVVVKKATDESNAARYQAAFTKAGARLRVLPAEDTGAPTQSAAASSPANDSSATSGDDGSLKLMPSGSDILTRAERPETESVDVDTEHLKVQGAVFVTDEPTREVAGPNVDHLTLAELGALLGIPSDTEMLVQELDVSFDLAEVGAILGALEDADEETLPPPAPDFEIAEPGETLDTRAKPNPPAAPDTSHLTMEKGSDDETT